jgi:hypothetical protein
MKQKYKEKILERIRQFVISNYRKIDNDKFIMGDLPYNYKCHLNSIQRVKEGRASKVYSCIAIHKNDRNTIVLHFINQLLDGKFQDNTWGFLFSEYDYYIIREINESEYISIGEIFESIRESLVKSNSNWLLRKLFRIHLDII